MVTNNEKPCQMHLLPGRLGLGLLEPAQASKNEIISSDLQPLFVIWHIILFLFPNVPKGRRVHHRFRKSKHLQGQLWPRVGNEKWPLFHSVGPRVCHVTFFGSKECHWANASWPDNPRSAAHRAAQDLVFLKYHFFGGCPKWCEQCITLKAVYRAVLSS